MEVAENGAAPAAPEGNAAPAVSTPASIESTMASVFDKMNPQERVNRSDNGQFSSKEPAAVEDAEPPAPDQALEERQPQTAAPSEPAKPAIAFPQSLPAELRDKWGAAPPEVAEWVAKREAESHKRITELGEAAKTAEPIRQLIEQHRASFQGVNPVEGLQRLLAANKFLEDSPTEAIQWLARAYNVDLSGFGASQDGEQAAAEYALITQLNGKIAQLERQIRDTSQRVQSREQQEYQERTSALSKLVEDFAKDKTYWADIENDLFDQVQVIRAREPDLLPEKVLEKAHERVLKLNEAVANKLNEATRKEAEAKEAAEKKRKADEAKRLASLNVKSNTGASPKANGRWEDTMREVADRLLG